MKAREIRKVAKPRLVEGWLSVDKPSMGSVIAFFDSVSKPDLESDGAWRRKMGCVQAWNHHDWRAAYGSAALPKPGKCERVRLEL